MTRVIRLQPSGKEISCEEGETVLEALERAGYALPNNCRAGACGECKTRVLSGDFDQGFVLDMALSQEDKMAGFGLMCMAKPVSDVLEIDYGTSDAQPLLYPPVTNKAHVVVDKVRRAQALTELRLRPLGERLRYWPGQYVMLTDTDGRVPPRSYSIANAPRPDGELTLMVARHTKGQTSTWITNQLSEGDTVLISGPYGTFVGDVSLELPVLCLAGGTGIAPLLALTEAALRRGFSLPVAIWHSARTEQEVCTRGILSYWEKRYPNFSFRLVLTRELAQERSATVSSGKRIPVLLAEEQIDLSGHQVFISGSPGFVEDCRNAVLSRTASPTFVFTEAYFPRAQPDLPDPSRLIASAIAS
jgi:CDP-4-dehydro-6-deoxyglucose reductase